MAVEYDETAGTAATATGASVMKTGRINFLMKIPSL